MIYVMLRGRLCNQMFQIAAAKALAIDNNTRFVCHDTPIGIIPTKKESEAYNQTIFKKINFERLKPMNYIVHRDASDFSYKKINFVNNILLDGYYQSEKYFSHHKEEIIKLYECPVNLKKEIDKDFLSLLERKDTCSVHVRRGDYLKYKDNHNNLSIDYYEKCFNEKKESHFVFFSDDIEWCKENFKNKDATFINTNSDIVDFYLMSRMKNNIIANSSFSWWAAWINKNKDKHVIAPKKWFGPKNNHLYTGDIIPNDWEIIDG